MKVLEITIACTHTIEMIQFYEGLFGFTFKTIQFPKGEIYEATLKEIKLTLCPASIAGISASENRHQLTYQVSDIKNCIHRVELLGGNIISELQETNQYLMIAIRDVDGNSIILKELFNKH